MGEFASMTVQRRALMAGAAAALAMPSVAARAEVSEIRISKGYGVDFLPLIVMEHEGLFEKAAAAAGMSGLKATYRTIDGGNNINDALLAGAIDVASIGVPGFALLWSKTLGTPQGIRGVAAVVTMANYLNTRNPKVKSLRDFTDADRIAVPGIKTSFSAIALEIGAAKTFGPKNYAKLDPLTVSMPYPVAVQAMLSGAAGIDSHFASPPFAYIELADPKIHTVTNSTEILGQPATNIMAYVTERFHAANPKVYGVLLTALKEAEDMINADKEKAAQIYVQTSKVKVNLALVKKVLDDPNNVFTMTPQATMTYIQFMHGIGLIKHRPAGWQDLFFPEIHDLHGS